MTVFDRLEEIVEECKDSEAKKKLSLLVKNLGLLSKYMDADKEKYVADPSQDYYDSNGRVKCQVDVIRDNLYGLLPRHDRIISRELEEMFNDPHESQRKILNFLEYALDLVKIEYSS
jgi:hypothetical protein